MRSPIGTPRALTAGMVGGLATTLALGCGAPRATPEAPPASVASAAADSVERPVAVVPESVSVGYGNRPRAHLSGAVGSVTAHDLRRAQATRIEELLQGRIAGVRVVRTASGELSVRVRGSTPFGGRSEPLFVVDGLPIATGGLATALNGIAPSDIARIDVLKDAGATAIYGSRGGSGVIVITTKRGR